MSKIKAKRWAMVPESLLVDFSEGKVSADAVALYALIRLRWGGYDCVFPRQEIIAQLANCSIRKIQRDLKVLNDTGWIISERQHRTNGNNQYFICDEAFEKPTASKFSKDVGN